MSPLAYGAHHLAPDHSEITIISPAPPEWWIEFDADSMEDRLRVAWARPAWAFAGVGRPNPLPGDWGRHTSAVFPLSLPAVVLAIASFILGRPLVHTRYRRRHNLCLTCGYDLTGNVSGRCSECGTAVEVTKNARTERRGPG